MIHEVLLALAGCPGDLFVYSNGKLAVSTDIPFLHDSERAQLAPLLQVAQLYMQLDAYLKRLRTPWLNHLKSRYYSNASPSAADHDQQPQISSVWKGVYQQALSGALASYLDEYRSVIVQVERKVLDYLDPDTDGGRTPLAYLNVTFAQKCNTGLPAVRQAMLKLQHACLAALYRQITTWMLYGELNDPYSEFFIKNESPSEARRTAIFMADVVVELQQEQTRWYSEFVLDSSMIPPFMSTRVAETILFVGKAISSIRESPTPENQQAISSISTTFLPDFIALTQQQTVGYKDAPFELVVDRVKRHVSKILWKALVIDRDLRRHLKAFKDFYLLGKGEFFVSFLDGCDLIRQRAAARLVLITEYDMNSLFRRTARDTTAEHDPAVDSFAFRFIKSDERPPKSLVSPFESELVNLPLRLEYEVTWPLDLVLTQPDLEKYNVVFTFLIYLRRVQMRIQRIWSLTNNVSRGTRRGSTTHEPLSRIFWTIRGRMMFFVDHLWSYIQMDVLESQYSALMNRLFDDQHDSEYGQESGLESEDENTIDQPLGIPPTHASPETSVNGDFESLQQDHAAYLDAICKGCFLDDSAASKSLGSVVRTLLELIVRYCGVVEDSLRSGRLRDDSIPRVESLRQEFDRSCQFLFDALAGARTSDTHQTSDGAAAFEKLLLRLDYNRWFSVGFDISQSTKTSTAARNTSGGGLVGF
ncbi:hypothetical protein SmJEL517_g02440 [Synchytrium microbalum]|uniref:Spindle pole body component n=1 Tax=Synchytrium microbalum TaxID=1806994 RepID=A0A507C687_9FUNG|nr:uncharacterized protein SmJEL517_g02440 [Synchytrium microbalum]TPX35021.1 hypothetical protein SmJEL517_g02440 [Synchytrium microbalum]